MSTIASVFTNLGRDLILKSQAGIVSHQNITSFKVGEGGWMNDGSGVQVRRAPDPTLTDLDCILDVARVAKRYPTGGRGSFQKALTSGNFSYDAATHTLSISLLVDFGEFNNDGSGNAPEIWEFGVFAGTTMVAYGTVPKLTKTPESRFIHTFKLSL